MAMGRLSISTRRVLQCVARIPIGYVTPYGAIANTVGGSPRVVGRVMAANPFPLLIPMPPSGARISASAGMGWVKKLSGSFFKRRIRGIENLWG